MKKLFLFSALFLSAATVFNACKMIDDAIHAEVGLTMGELTFDVPVITTAGPIAPIEKTTTVNVDSIIKAANSQLGALNIRDAVVNSCSVELVNSTTPNDNLGVLSSCKAELASDSKTEYVTLADLPDNPDNGQTVINLPVNDQLHLKDYFGANAFKYRLSATTRRTTSGPMTLRATIRYTLDIGK